MFFKKYVTRWNMAICSGTETDKIQEYLNLGYEPFGVVSKPVPAKESNLATAGTQKQAYSIVELLYFKQEIKVPFESKTLIKEDDNDDETKQESEITPLC